MATVIGSTHQLFLTCLGHLFPPPFTQAKEDRLRELRAAMAGALEGQAGAEEGLRRQLAVEAGRAAALQRDKELVGGGGGRVGVGSRASRGGWAGFLLDVLAVSLHVTLGDNGPAVCHIYAGPFGGRLRTFHTSTEVRSPGPD